MMTWEDVRDIGLTLPGAEEGTSYGAPALKARKQLVARWRDDLNAVVLRTTFEEREGLMADDPKVYFITDHYLNYEYVLVNLAAVGREALNAMILRSYQLATKKR